MNSTSITAAEGLQLPSLHTGKGCTNCANSILMQARPLRVNEYRIHDRVPLTTETWIFVYTSIDVY